MSQFYQFKWPTSTKNEVATSQTTIANTALVLNGSYANQTTGTVNFLAYGIVPYIKFIGTTNFTANFIINGYQNGVFITEEVKINNAQTGQTNNCFDVIQSIIPNANVNDLTVGINDTGYFPIILLNTAKQNVSTINYALNMIAAAEDPASYTIYLSLENNIGTGKYSDLIANNVFVEWKNTTTNSQLIQSTDLAQNLLIQIGPNNYNSTLTSQFLQL